MRSTANRVLASLAEFLGVKHTKKCMRAHRANTGSTESLCECDALERLEKAFTEFRVQARNAVEKARGE